MLISCKHTHNIKYYPLFKKKQKTSRFQTSIWLINLWILFFLQAQAKEGPVFGEESLKMNSVNIWKYVLLCIIILKYIIQKIQQQKTVLKSGMSLNLILRSDVASVKIKPYNLIWWLKGTYYDLFQSLGFGDD